MKNSTFKLSISYFPVIDFNETVVVREKIQIKFFECRSINIFFGCYYILLSLEKFLWSLANITLQPPCQKEIKNYQARNGNSINNGPLWNYLIWGLTENFCTILLLIDRISNMLIMDDGYVRLKIPIRVEPSRDIFYILARSKVHKKLHKDTLKEDSVIFSTWCFCRTHRSIEKLSYHFVNKYKWLPSDRASE